MEIGEFCYLTNICALHTNYKQIFKYYIAIIREF